MGMNEGGVDIFIIVIGLFGLVLAVGGVALCGLGLARRRRAKASPLWLIGGLLAAAVGVLLVVAAIGLGVSG